MTTGKKIVMLVSHCFTTNVLYNHLSQSFHIEKIITEEPLRGLALAKRRIRKLGIWKVSGQVLFSVIIVPLLRRLSVRRRQQIQLAYNMNTLQVPASKCVHFANVNDADCIEALVALKPDIVIVNGTRILSKRLLTSLNAVFINMHAGITPQYRGVHGGYWALYNDDPSNCGVTVHMVDAGIDTGNVLYQGVISVTKEDNFITYPDLQLGEGLPLMTQALIDAVEDRIQPVPRRHFPSKLWYHPGFWQYTFHRLFRNKK